MDDNSPVAALIERVAHGDQSAWDHIMRRYTPLIRTVCLRFGLTGADADDVGGTVWLRLVAGLTAIREPAALPGWLATTTHRECIVIQRDRKRQIPIADQQYAIDTEPAPEARLLIAESHRTLRDALASTSDRDRRLLSLLFSDPPTPYTTISAILDIPIGAIGPTRQRCLARLRRNPDVAALMM